MDRPSWFAAVGERATGVMCTGGMHAPTTVAGSLTNGEILGRTRKLYDWLAWAGKGRAPTTLPFPRSLL